MKACTIFFSVILLTFHGYACANFSGSGTKFNGAWASGGPHERFYQLQRALYRDLAEDGAKMEVGLRNSTNFNDRSDYSIALMYLGRSKEAVTLLQSLEKEQPGKYFVAANLGTAYELTGNNEEASRWIAEGIRRNPDSHEGTEWLHLKILEAKIAQQKDPDYFKKHSVLDIQPHVMTDETLIGKEKLNPGQMAEAIQHQLTERMQFVKPPDPAVASLLFDYAALEAGTRTLESAQRMLRMAVNYGYPDDKIRPLIALYDHRIAMRKTEQYAFYSFITLGVIGILFLGYRKGAIVISRRDLQKA
jgi:tetratricopeptide (TPR) repeat protein